MKILIATGIYPPEIGGPATYSKLLEQELPKHDIEVDVLPFSKVRHLPKIVRHIAYFFAVMRRALRARLILALDPVSVGLPAMCAAKLLRKKFILRVPGDYAWEQFSLHRKDIDEFITPDEFQKRKFDFITELRRKIQHLVARNAVKIITPSNYLKTIVEQWGIGSEKTEVIYNTFTSKKITETKEELRKQLNLDGKIILSAGRLVPWKGMDTLIKTIPEIAKEFPDVKLYLAGDGPELENLQLTAHNLQLTEHVVFLGQLSKEKLAEYVKAIDVFTLNTGYEGLSHMLLEVMSLETPIVTTNIGGNLELIENGKSGMLVGYNDQTALTISIINSLKDEDAAKELAQNAKEKSEQFTKEKMIQNTINLFQSV